MKLERAVQIGIVVPDLERATRLLGEIFGIGPFHFIEWPNRPESKYYFRGRQEPIQIRQAFTQVGPLELELVQPLEGENNAYNLRMDVPEYKFLGFIPSIDLYWNKGVFLPLDSWILGYLIIVIPLSLILKPILRVA